MKWNEEELLEELKKRWIRKTELMRLMGLRTNNVEHFLINLSMRYPLAEKHMGKGGSWFKIITDEDFKEYEQ